MSQLRNLIILLFAALALYTAFTIPNDGINFVPGFVGDLLSVTWRGQINLDFISYLTLSGLWVAWRHDFSVGGIITGVIVLLGGLLLFAPYLIYAISKSRGDVGALLLGQMRAKADNR